MKLVLASRSAADQQNKSITQERLINIYPVPAPEGAGAQFELRNVPGTRDFVSLPGPFFRAMWAVEGVLYAVVSGGFYQVNDNGTFAYLAAITDDENTSMAGHRSSVTLTADGGYYLWDGTDLTQPAAGRLTEIGSLAFLDQFTILSELDGREVEWTEVGTPGTRNGLYFKTAEARDDKVIRIMDAGSYFVVLKQKSTEIWSSTNLGGASAFRRLEGGVAEVGLKSFNLATKAADWLFMIGHDGVAYRTKGQMSNDEVVSTPAINRRLAENDPTHCFYYEDRGHCFCVIRYSDRPADCYDTTTRTWHERASGVKNEPWDVIGAAFCYGRWHLADRIGRIFRLGVLPFDADGPMRRTIVSRELYIDGRRTTVKLLEFLGRFGYSGIEETGPNWLLGQDGQPILGQDGQPLLGQSLGGGVVQERPARLVLRVSRDGGNAFGLPKIRDIGKTGQYEATCRFRSMGQFRRMTAEITMTDPIDIALLSEANVEI